MNRTHLISVSILVATAIIGCMAAAQPASYGTALEECNRKAKTCKESIDCENLVRADAGRLPRLYDGCQ